MKKIVMLIIGGLAVLAPLHKTEARNYEENKYKTNQIRDLA